MQEDTGIQRQLPPTRPLCPDLIRCSPRRRHVPPGPNIRRRGQLYCSSEGEDTLSPREVSDRTGTGGCVAGNGRQPRASTSCPPTGSIQTTGEHLTGTATTSRQLAEATDSTGESSTRTARAHPSKRNRRPAHTGPTRATRIWAATNTDRRKTSHRHATKKPRRPTPHIPKRNLQCR